MALAFDLILAFSWWPLTSQETLFVTPWTPWTDNQRHSVSIAKHNSSELAGLSAWHWVVAFWECLAHLHCTLFWSHVDCMPLTNPHKCQMCIVMTGKSKYKNKQTIKFILVFVFMKMAKRNPEFLCLSFLFSSRSGVHEIKHLGCGTGYVVMLSGKLFLFSIFFLHWF